MRVPACLEIGVASHTGRVRAANEDDYLIIVPAAAAERRSRGCLLAIADGMGGVAGGSEASRTALRALGAEFLETATEPTEGDDAERVSRARQRTEAGFERACGEVFARSTGSLQLRDMGTTMTTLTLVGVRAVVGHVGDTRCVLVRDRRARAWTQDHAVAEPRNLLTRCIGAGQTTEQVDIDDRSLRPGDLVILMSDGVWNTVPIRDQVAAVTTAGAQLAAEQLVAAADVAGGPDNSTAIVICIHTLDFDGALVELDLPSEETRIPQRLPPTRGSLMSPTWPWWMAVASLILGIGAVSRLVYGIDLLGRGCRVV